MSNKINYSKITDNSLSDENSLIVSEIFRDAGLNEIQSNLAMLLFLQYRQREINSFNSMGLENIDKEALKNYVFGRLKDSEDVISMILREFSMYLYKKDEFFKIYNKSKKWEDVYKEVYEGEEEEFIDVIEEVYKTNIKDVKHLQELTGLKSKELERDLKSAREYKYKRALEVVLSSGGKYKDLLNVNFDSYGLTDSEATNCLYRSIGHYYNFMDNRGFMLTTGLRHLAETIEAPYSVLIKAHKLYK
jgi:hypothetical protein